MTAEFHLCATASEISVRALLAETRARLRAAQVGEVVCGTVEIVLAEALNNIVEHACAEAADTRIDLRAALGPCGLRCVLSDRGAPLPGLLIPEGSRPQIGPDTDGLPEGGFGWMLIHSLTREVHYERDGAHNRLTLCFDLSPVESAAR